MKIPETISNYNRKLKQTDPELIKIIDNLINNDLKNEYENINTTNRILVILTTLITNQSKELYGEILQITLTNHMAKPVQIKEMLYQTIIYTGLSKSYEFIEITNNKFKQHKTQPQQPQNATTTQKTRKQEGYNIQAQHYTKQWLDEKIENTPENQKQLWNYISSYAFGDIYTRKGLTKKQRELITIAALISLRGCEDQLEIHLKGAIKINITKKEIISTIMILIPYIGFPRIHNTLKILNKI